MPNTSSVRFHERPIDLDHGIIEYHSKLVSWVLGFFFSFITRMQPFSYGVLGYLLNIRNRYSSRNEVLPEYALKNAAREFKKPSEYLQNIYPVL